MVAVVGPDARAYLQGQLSQDVDALEVGGSAETFLLQPAGKVDAWMRVSRLADDHYLPHVFERLYASKRRPDVRESGSGLGLAIVRELVQAMGGSVWAESQPGGGANLVVQLPGMESSDVEE